MFKVTIVDLSISRKFLNNLWNFFDCIFILFIPLSPLFFLSKMKKVEPIVGEQLFKEKVAEQMKLCQLCIENLLKVLQQKK